ncbi:MAG: hypothetical protein HQK87_03520 [Nitrospinae bacterium]|nr:hypothetical protein [Nitrospinota bacterium]
MNYDPKGVEAKRLKQEREVAALVSGLEEALGRFRACLNQRRSLRGALSDRLEKVALRRKETVVALKEMVKRNDRIKSRLEADREELTRLKRDEATLTGRYQELLAGRLPTDPSDITLERLAGEGVPPADLSAEREKFLGKVRQAFDELDGQLAETGGRREKLERRVGEAERELAGADKRRELLFKKLDIYKQETTTAERRLQETVVEEEAALQEYADFIRRIKRVLALPATVQAMLGGCDRPGDGVGGE